MCPVYSTRHLSYAFIYHVYISLEHLNSNLRTTAWGHFLQATMNYMYNKNQSSMYVQQKSNFNLVYLHTNIV